MKTIKLIFSRISFYFLSNKLIFIMFLLGGIVCSTSFIYFYGNQLSTKKSEVSTDSSYYTYTLKFDEPASYYEIKNSSLLNSEIIEDVMAVHYLLLDDLPKEFNKNNYIDYYLRVCTQINNKHKLFSKMGRSEFYDEEIKNGKNVIILPNCDDIFSLAQGDTVTLSGREYEVIGVNTFIDNFYIPSNTFDKCGYSIDEITIYTTERMSRTENSQFIANLHAEFPQSDLIESPSESYKAADSYFIGDFFLIRCEFIISALSFMFLIKFLIDKSNLENLIYLIVGATKRKLFLILILENIIISGIIGIISIAIHLITYNQFFVYFNVYEGLQYSIMDYIIIFISIIILSCITAIPFIISCLKNSIIINKNKYN